MFQSSLYLSAFRRVIPAQPRTAQAQTKFQFATIPPVMFVKQESLPAQSRDRLICR